MGVAGCSRGASVDFPTPVAIADLLAIKGQETYITLHARDLSGCPMAYGILVLDLGDEGKLGYPLNSRGAITLMFSGRSMAQGRISIARKPPRLVSSEDGEWRKQVDAIITMK